MEGRIVKHIMLIFLISCFSLAGSQVGFAKGEWEVSLHYGSWNLSLLESYLEGVLEDTVADELKEAIIEEHPEKSGLEEEYYQDLNLDSTGNNLGVEMRLYPAGKGGSFSVGFSLEKTEMEVDLDSSASYQFADGSYFEGSGSSKLLIDPISYHLSFRWDMAPSGRLDPYLSLGLGLASLTGYLYYEANGEFYDAATEESESEAYVDEVNLEDLKLKITPLIVQLNLGLKLRISEDFHFLVDAGIWNGFLVRGSVAYRL